MKNEVSLTKINKGIFGKFTKVIKKFLMRFSRKTTGEMDNIINKDSELSDFNILKDLVEGKIQIKDLDEDTRGRLIIMCNNRLNEVNKKVEEKDKEINKLKKVIDNVSNF